MLDVPIRDSEAELFDKWGELGGNVDFSVVLLVKLAGFVVDQDGRQTEDVELLQNVLRGNCADHVVAGHVLGLQVLADPRDEFLG